ncbi:hypothetical protein [Streptomyces sp. NPDC101393]|uniref:hypothetical protein n=1 Tax=Streptomyces sp. NPDC101393 TaxID=3366141 RepID=UPI0038288581
MPAAVSVCPHPLDTRTPPVPETLTYGLTIPAALISPAIARHATHVILEAHGLHDVTTAALQVVGELTACACRFTASEDVYPCAALSGRLAARVPVRRASAAYAPPSRGGL